LQIFAYLFLFCSRSLCAGTVRFSPFVNETETVYELVDMNLFFYNVFMQWSASDESVLCRSLICIWNCTCPLSNCAFIPCLVWFFCSGSTLKNKQMFNIICELPETVARTLVPRMRVVKGTGKAISYLTPPRILLALVTAWLRRGRWFDDQVILVAWGNFLLVTSILTAWLPPFQAGKENGFPSHLLSWFVHSTIAIFSCC